MPEKPEGSTKNEQSRDTGNTGHKTQNSGKNELWPADKAAYTFNLKRQTDLCGSHATLNYQVS